MACHRLVHRIVEDFGGQMVQCTIISAANIHARPPANRFEAFKHLDIGRRVPCAAGSGRVAVEEI
ncbi:hypothetical protein GCM10011505_46700 [Tistrella bauzanensis]|uniref:Uncharacterized protein n=1 Tax=Tistrella bauzanensis TaxID=657419 RepID=A0ABQ1J5K8_9PROT|nr:hypothetical protein GCM10011505_46700 [Tistrella bauzanensis]